MNIFYKKSRIMFGNKKTGQGHHFWRQIQILAGNSNFFVTFADGDKLSVGQTFKNFFCFVIHTADSKLECWCPPSLFNQKICSRAIIGALL